jgi:N-acetylneuraminate lyase
MTSKLRGLVAATHTPFHANGDLNLDVVEKQAEHLFRTGVDSVFIGGTTGESHSLTTQERLDLAKRWREAARIAKLRLIVHVGSNCLADARAMAAQAQTLRADAIAALAPSYFKPQSLNALVEFCAEVAHAAPDVPFYFYDIPAMTGVQFSMSEFLTEAEERIPTLAGIKFTNSDMASFQRCIHFQEKKFEMLWGIDEYLLAAFALGATSAVGSSYNFAAPLYRRMIAAFERGDLATARAEQLRSVQLIGTLASFGYMAAAKTVMSVLGVEVGPARTPHANLTPNERRQLRARLDEIDFFEWIRQ